MKIWITKYALTKGIVTVDAELCLNVSDSMIRVIKSGYFNGFYHGEGRNWHRSEVAAKTRAEAMRLAKIASLQKQQRELELLRF